MAQIKKTYSRVCSCGRSFITERLKDRKCPICKSIKASNTNGGRYSILERRIEAIGLAQ